MKICPNCKFENDDESVYCINCGHRIDGLVRCPNCGEPIDKATEFCPKCGAKINIHVKATSRSFSERKKKIDPIFQIVFVAISLLLFVESLSLVWGDIIRIGGSSYNIDWNYPGTMVYFLFSQWKYDMSGNMAATRIISFIIALGQIVGTYVCAIIGIVKGIKELVKRRNCKMILGRYLALVLMINLSSFSLLVSLYPDAYPSNFATISNCLPGNSIHAMFGSFVSFFMIMSIYHTFKIFDRKRKLVFVAKILLSLGFVALPLIVMSSNISNLYATNSGHLGIYSTCAYLILEYPECSVAIKSLSFLTGFFALTVSILASSAFVYLASNYFSNRSEKVSFALPFNVINLLLFALSFNSLIINLIGFLSLYNIYGEVFHIGASPIINSGLGFAIACLILASFILIKKNSRRDKLMKSINEGN